MENAAIYNLGVYLAIIGIVWSMIMIYIVLCILFDSAKRWFK